MIKIEHIAIWVKDLEKSGAFYEQYFGAEANQKYENKQKQFTSYFSSFGEGARLEIMYMPSVTESKDELISQNLGLIHFAISVGSEANVNQLTETIREDGYTILSEPRRTGDGYYESVVLDSEQNRIEITV
jgi:lactoylglutathione lyase